MPSLDKVFSEALGECKGIFINADGVPCIEGTRIPVRAILQHLRYGNHFVRVREAFPTLTDDEQITDAIEFAAWVLEQPEMTGLE